MRTRTHLRITCRSNTATLLPLAIIVPPVSVLPLIVIVPPVAVLPLVDAIPPNGSICRQHAFANLCQPLL